MHDATITAAQFDAIAALIRAKEKTCCAARRVLIGGESPSSVAAALELSTSSVSNTVTRFRKANALISEAYLPQNNDKNTNK